MTHIAIWHGTEQESYVLLEVLQRSCTCPSSPNGRRCPAHAMLLDQRVVDGLLFMRRMAAKLIREEFARPAPQPASVPGVTVSS